MEYQTIEETSTVASKSLKAVFTWTMKDFFKCHWTKESYISSKQYKIEGTNKEVYVCSLKEYLYKSSNLF